jgi:hypothetical protein
MIYRTAEANIDTHYYRDDGLLFWIYVLCTSRAGGNTPVKSKPVNTIPREVALYFARDRDPDRKQVVLDAIDRGECWYFKIEGKGWRPHERGGAKEVMEVQSVLDWLKRFEVQNTVDGSRLIFAAVETSVDVR